MELGQKEIQDTKLYRSIISDENIFKAIYSLESYIFEVGLLEPDSLKTYNDLSDKYNKEIIEPVIQSCKNKLKSILCEELSFFEAKVYFRAKKVDNETEKVIFRPMHTADIITQICIICLLNFIMFRDTDHGRVLSGISSLLPNCFYGNMPSTDINNLFINWKTNYTRYINDIESTYHDNMESKQFKSEIRFDLENFFPSINPLVIYNLILNKMEIEFQDKEYEVLKVVLYKLLFIKMNLTKEEKMLYYLDALKENSPIENEVNFCIGIPQGLPQSYYFGNLYMTIVAKIYKHYYSGKTFFYVDDSVIYSKENNIKDFENNILLINEEIEQEDNLYKKRTFPITENLETNWKKVVYKVKVHDKNKSSMCKIEDHYLNEGKSYLQGIAIDASRIGMEFWKSFDELDQKTLRSKIEVWLNGIEAELELETKRGSLMEKDNSSYIKILNRYRRFFKYRLKVMEIRLEENKTIDEYVTVFCNKCNNWAAKSKEELFERLDTDIFLVEAYKLIELTSKDKQQDEIKKAVNLVENVFFTSNENIKSRYFTKSVSNKIRAINNDKFETLKKYAKNNLRGDRRNTQRGVCNKIKEIINDFNKFIKNTEIIPAYATYIAEHVNDYQRNILNMVISNIIQVDIDDNMSVTKHNRYALKYFEFRILMRIRNMQFNFESDIEKIKCLLSSDEQSPVFENVDYAIYEVLDIFNLYVKKINEIDNLIATHQYVSGIWKNGSKFLHFYTLHNQEHSVELIKLCVKIILKIDCLQLKNIDYYILFLACYLHDISMVYYPKLASFNSDNYESDQIYTTFKKDMLNKGDLDKYSIKDLLIKYFQQMDGYYEKQVRNSHVKKSSALIKNERKLNYIEASIRAIVAEISEAHGYAYNDVYSLKSMAKQNIISKKYMMIILRLADLFDMTKKRINFNLLRNNLENMSGETQFHWISHLVIDDCKIYSEYNHKNRDSSSLLSRNCFDEKIIIAIYLNGRDITTVTNKGCKDFCAKLSTDKKEIIVTEDETSVGCKVCIFSCKWMQKKNQYLFDEILALQKYLKRNQVNNLFNTKFEIKLIFVNDRPVDVEFLEIVREVMKE